MSVPNSFENTAMMRATPTTESSLGRDEELYLEYVLIRQDASVYL
jgi:hypothetical protein